MKIGKRMENKWNDEKRVVMVVCFGMWDKMTPEEAAKDQMSEHNQQHDHQNDDDDTTGFWENVRKKESMSCQVENGSVSLNILFFK